MKLKSLVGGAVLACLVLAAPATARDQLGLRDAVTIEPEQAYIFFRSSQRGDIRFLREVTADEQEAWQAKRDDAFTRARAQWERRAAQWDRMSPDCRGNGRLTPQCQGRGERPAEVTNENFAYPGPEMANFVQVAGGRQFTRGDDAYSYFIAVNPGTYILYGDIIGTAQGANVGTCLCMGSVRFEARAGRITDIGELRYPRIEAFGSRSREGIVGPNRLAYLAVNTPSESMTVPDRLAGQPLVRGELRAADKMPNYFGVMIDRLPAVPGVLAYERDRVIDLRGDSDAAGSSGQ